ncbi:hypothetical protein KP509_1Z306800, partial [Ceratopteris richardii]
LVHPYGPCLLKGGLAQQHRNMNGLAAEILHNDEERIKAFFLRNRLAHDAERSLATSNEASALTQTFSGISYGVGNFIAEVGIGTPVRNFLLVLDTGSDLAWTQCTPCETATSCYNQTRPLFDPVSSSSYTAIPCQAGCGACSTDGLCLYETTYGDNSSTQGNLAYETFTIGSATIQNYIFGCGRANQGIFGSVDGFLGLGWDAVGMASQSVSFFKGVFAYCLPNVLLSTTSTGFIEFGIGVNTSESASSPYTSMIKNTLYPSFYFVWLKGISVGGTPLSLISISPTPPTSTDEGGTLIDSGTVITRLPEADYITFRNSFIAGSSNIAIVTPPADFLLDTCFQFNNDTSIPVISLQFDGFEFSLPAENIVYPLDLSSNTVCLAFAPTTVTSLQNLIIVGNYQTQGYLLTFDTVSAKMGIHATKAC